MKLVAQATRSVLVHSALQQAVQRLSYSGISNNPTSFGACALNCAINTYSSLELYSGIPIISLRRVGKATSSGKILAPSRSKLRPVSDDSQRNI